MPTISYGKVNKESIFMPHLWALCFLVCASVRLSVRSSVRLSVRSSVCPSSGFKFLVEVVYDEVEVQSTWNVVHMFPMIWSFYFYCQSRDFLQFSRSIEHRKIIVRMGHPCTGDTFLFLFFFILVAFFVKQFATDFTVNSYRVLSHYYSMWRGGLDTHKHV